MKVILEFNLPEEQEAFDHAQKGWKYKSILDDFDQQILRKRLKYEAKLSASNQKLLEAIRNELHELMQELG